MLTLVALLTLVSVATGAIPDGSYTVTPCSCTGSCTAAICGITVAEGGSKWTANTYYTFGEGSRKYCDIIDYGRYNYSGSGAYSESEVTMTSFGTPTVWGDSSCHGAPASQFKADYTVESNGVVSLTSRTTQATIRYFPDAIATGAIPDCSYTVTYCPCTGSCTAAICGMTVAEGGSKWKTNTHYTFSDGKYCDIIDNGRYSYSGSEVTMTSIGTPTASGDGSLTHSCQWDPYSVTVDYTVESNGVVSLTSRTTQATVRLFPDACMPPPPPPRPPPLLPVGAVIAIGVSVLVSLIIIGVAILGFVCWRRKRARMTERGGQLIPAPTYYMGMN
jgi:hypothetical protein